MEEDKFGYSPADEERELSREYHDAHRNENSPSIRRYIVPPPHPPWETAPSRKTYALRSLFCAMLAQASFEYIMGIFGQKHEQLLRARSENRYRAIVRNARTAHHWLFSEKDNMPLSFLSVCAFLGFDPSAIRYGLSKFPLLAEEEQITILRQLRHLRQSTTSRYYYEKRELSSAEEKLSPEDQWLEQMFASLLQERVEIKE